MPVVAGNGLQIVAAYIRDPYIALILQVSGKGKEGGGRREWKS